MISALTILLATQTAAPIQAPADPISEIVERSNRAMYDVPEALVLFRFSSDGTAASLREARRGPAKHGRLSQDDLLSVEYFNDGKRSLALKFGDQVYSDSKVDVRPSYEDATKEPLAPLDDERFDVNYDSMRGLILRAKPGFTVVSDEPKVGDEGYRRVVGRAVRASKDGTVNGTTIDFRILMDATGLIRRLEGEAKSKDGGAASFEYTCEPKIPDDEPFTFDVARLTGWTKVDATPGAAR